MFHEMKKTHKMCRSLIGRRMEVFFAGLCGPHRRWRIIGGKALPTLAVLALLGLGVAHPFGTDGLRAQEEAAHEQPAPLRAAVIPDEEKGIIRFIINGKEVARLDEHSLYVVKDVTFGGSLTDTGSAWIERYFAEDSDAE